MDTHKARTSDNRIYLSGAGDPSLVRTELEPGDRVLNRFTLEENCGEGALGTVFKARDAVEQSCVALKISRPLTAEDTHIKTVFVREVSLSRLIADFTNIRQAFAAHPWPLRGAERMVLSLEYADGGSLRSWLARQAERQETDRDELVHVVREILLGLCALHEVGIVYVDFKPENVVFVRGRPKLADCGMAVVCVPYSDGDIPTIELSTAQRGTSEYMHPSVHRGDLALWGRASDFYAFGKVLGEIVEASASAFNVGGRERDRLYGLQTIIEKAMSPSIEDGYLDAKDILADFETWAAHDDTILPEPPSTQREAGKNACLEETAADGSPDAVDATLLAINEIHESVVRAGTKPSIRFLRSKHAEVHELSPGHPVAGAIKQRYENACKNCNKSLRRAEAAVLKMEWAFALKQLLAARQYLPEHSGLSECIGILHAIVRALERGLGDRRFRNRPDEVRRRWLAFHSSSRVDEACTYLGKRLHAIKVRP